ncbi:M28 family peptidase [Silvibacterium sp.]|uniref:M28 family peptidase n=1 Tax=Silvibacterium sp. TaxID=1964179 RepID=UPI0039E2E996
MLVWTLPQKRVDMLVHHVPKDNAIRVAQLRQTFQDFHCESTDLQEQALLSGPNVLCTLPGNSPEAIVIAAHYQVGETGQGAVENWSGATMLPFLYHALTAQPREHTYIFAAFAGEAGAQAWMNRLTKKQRHNLTAMIALDSLGLGPAAFYLRPVENHPSTPELGLVSQLELAAHESGLPEALQVVPGKWFRTDDTRQFRFKGVPSILIHSVDAAHSDLPGSADDTAAAIQSDSYYENYRLLCGFVADLDQAPSIQQNDPDPRRFSMPPSPTF